MDTVARTARARGRVFQGILAQPKMNTERQNILGRIREALRVPAPVPGAHNHKPGHAVSETEAAKHIREWLPAVGDTFEARVELFRANSIELRTDFRLLASYDELTRELTEIRDKEGWKKIALHQGELT